MVLAGSPHLRGILRSRDVVWVVPAHTTTLAWKDAGVSKAVPEPDEVTDFYWAAASRGQLMLGACLPHGHLNFPPDVSCAICGSRQLSPRAVSGRGIVYSFTVVRQPFDAAFTDDLPYVIALVELPEQAGLRMLANIVDVDPDDISVGDSVHVTFESRGDQVLPQFARDREPA
jgi:uncharacterized protein